MPKCENCGKEFDDSYCRTHKKIKRFCSRNCMNKSYHKDGRAAKNLRKYRQNLKIEVFRHYCNGIPKCACCGETIIEFLSLDHVNGRGAEHRKQICGKTQGWGGEYLYRWLRKNNYPEGYQVLCLNCNFAKGHFGICPHKQIK